MNIEQARQVSILSLLEQAGHPVRKRTNEAHWYCSPLRTERTPSFKVSLTKNLWYDFGLAEGGDVISLVQKMYGLSSFKQTLAKFDELVGGLETLPIHATSPSDKTIRAKSPSLKVVDLRPIESPQLLDLLRQRRIDPELAGRYLQEIHYTRGKRAYSALALTNDTGAETGLGFEVRNTHFKGTVGPKDISTIPGETDTVEVFEGMMDWLSRRAMDEGSPMPTSIILNSVAMKERAVERIQALKPDRVDLYLDRDATGEELVKYFQQALPGLEVVDRSSLYADYKDLNDFHVSQSVMSRLLDMGGFETRKKEHRKGPSL